MKARNKSITPIDQRDIIEPEVWLKLDAALMTLEVLEETIQRGRDSQPYGAFHPYAKCQHCFE